MKRFCCKKFQFFYSGEKALGLNIRVIKLSKEFIQRGQLDFDRNFLITEGYLGKVNDCKKVMVIKYCPFCGKELIKLYSDEEYVQEVMEP